MLSAVKAPPVRSAPQSDFIPAFDFLRASMMLLGVAIHSAFNYSRLVDTRWQWYFQDSTAAALPTAAVLFIHLFRMPLFFVMAGFFGALLWQRGERAFFQNRFKRVALPLLLGWVALYPLIIVAVTFAQYYQSNGILWGQRRNYASLLARENWPPLGPIHLWFLYYLLVFYSITGVLSWAWPARLQSTEKKGYGGKLARFAIRHFLWVQIGIVAGLLAAFRVKIIYTPSSFMVEWKYLAFYAVFFFSGWLLFGEKNRLSELHSNWPLTLPLGFLAGIIFVGIEMGYLVPPPSSQLLCFAFAVCLLVHGLIGISLRFYRFINPSVRYLSRASYWIYLIHLPVVYASAGLLARLHAPWPLKLIGVFAITTAFCLLSYHLSSLVIDRVTSRKPAGR